MSTPNTNLISLILHDDSSIIIDSDMKKSLSYRLLQAQKHLGSLRAVSNLLLKAANIESVIPPIIDVLSHTFQLQSVVIIDEMEKDTPVHMWYDNHVSNAALGYAAAKCALTYESLVSRDVKSLFRGVQIQTEDSADTVSKVVILLPMVNENGEIFGAIQFGFEGDIDNADLAFIAMIINQVATALARAHSIARERELRQVAETLATDNAALYASACEAIKVREDFLAIASHELMQPLFVLALQVEILQRLAQQELVKAHIAKIRLHVKKLASSVTNLFDIAKLTVSGVEKNVERVDLQDLVSRAIDALSAELERAKIHVEVDIVGPVVGYWNQARIEQVISNLIGNAIKYGAGNQIEVRVYGTAESAHISVRDHGIGISTSDHDKVFNRYQRTERGRAHAGGLGLGLYITKSIVTAHGGTIVLSSVVGEGSTFTVNLPLKPEM